MIFPILYSQGTTDFTDNGIGLLADATKCRVTAELTGYYELEMDYPVGGLHFEEITDRAIIKARLPQVTNPQLFEVYEISKPISGIVTVKAQHISYGMQGIPVSPFTAGGVVAALAEIKNHAVIDCPFELLTDKDTTGTYTVKEPTPMSLCLRGQQGSIVDTYAGELELDNYRVRLVNRRGADHGVVIRYGKNLTDLKQQQNCSNVASGVYPYWVNVETGETVELPEKIVKAPLDLPFERVQVLDLTAQFETKPTEEQLRNRATKYVKDNEIWKPRVNLKVSYVQLEQTAEYKGSALLERVELGDTVSVEFPRLGVSSKARATKITYDVLLGRIDKVQLGGAAPSLADTIARQDKELQKVPTTSDIQKAVSNATNWITNGKGYMVAVKGADGSWQEICSLDNPDIDKAMNVWRWNNGGFGHSSHGYNGPYETAITQDGAIVADFITTGTLSASLLKAGILQSKDQGKTFYLDLDNGVMRGNFESITIKGTNVADQKQIDEVNKIVEGLKDQLDGVIDTWYGEVIPTENNKPAVDWKAQQDKEKHSGDLYYVVGTGPDSGNAYRWIFLNGSWYWDKLANSDISKALDAAAKAQDTADGKRRVFVTTPYTPYDQGDLWAQGDTGELMRCNISRQSGAYQPSDWGPATDTGKKFSEFKITTDAISASVTGLSDSTTSRFQQTDEAISAKVESHGGDVQSFSWDLTASGFYLNANGKRLLYASQSGLTVDGVINAKSGNIGGWSLGADGVLGAVGENGLATYIAPPDVPGYGGNVFLAGGNSGGTPYTVMITQDGDLYAHKAHITGEVTATSGKIGGLDVNSIGDMISAKVNSTGGDSSSFGWDLYPSGFYLNANGKTVLYANQNGLAVNGTVNALAGKIGGWEIGGQILGNGFVSGIADGNRVGLAPGINPVTEEYQPADGLCFWAGAAYDSGRVKYENAPFRVYADGTIYAENGYFNGTVRAGKIEYGGGSGYVPEGGLESGTRTKLGYAVKAEKVITGEEFADHIKATNCTVTTLFYGGPTSQVVRVPTMLKNPVSGKYEEYSVLAIKR